MRNSVSVGLEVRKQLSSRIFFVNRVFWPDPSATSQLLFDLAFACAARFEVRVLASTVSDSTEGAGASPPGIIIHRLQIPLGSRPSLARRALQYLWFHCAAAFWLLRHLREGDVVVGMTDPPLLSVTLAGVCRVRGARLVTWLQDLYPEVATRLRVPLMAGPLGDRLCRLRDWSVHHADVNVVIGSRMRDYLVARGIPSEIVKVIANWTNDREVVPVPRDSNPLRREFGLEGKFVVGYSGTLGRAHEFETLLAAAHVLSARENIIFLFFGRGHSFEQLKRRVEAEGLAGRFRFLPLQPREALSLSLSLPDVHWVSLRPELEDCIVPSKIFGIAAAGRPMIAVAADDGELGRLARDFSFCTVVEPGDGRALAGEILHFYENPAACKEAGARARQVIEMHFSSAAAIGAWVDLLGRVGQGSAVSENRAPRGPETGS